MFRSSILLIMSLYSAFVFRLIYLLHSTFDDVFQQYGFSPSVSGLVYLGFGTADAGGIVLFMTFHGRIQEICMKIDGVATPRPKYRMIVMILCSPCVPIGIFIYGWAV